MGLHKELHVFQLFREEHGSFRYGFQANTINVNWRKKNSLKESLSFLYENFKIPEVQKHNENRPLLIQGCEHFLQTRHLVSRRKISSAPRREIVR